MTLLAIAATQYLSQEQEITSFASLENECLPQRKVLVSCEKLQTVTN